jgi:hypothetical protein
MSNRSQKSRLFWPSLRLFYPQCKHVSTINRANTMPIQKISGSPLKAVCFATSTWFIVYFCAFVLGEMAQWQVILIFN